MNLQNRAFDAPQFQLAPMIDVVFVVLVFFLATYAAAQEEKSLDIDLPAARSGEPETRSRHQLVVNVDEGGGLVLQRRKYSPEMLEKRLRQLVTFAATEAGKPAVIIRADADCPHRHVIGVMDLCKRARIQRIYFSTLPAE